MVVHSLVFQDVSESKVVYYDVVLKIRSGLGGAHCGLQIAVCWAFCHHTLWRKAIPECVRALLVSTISIINSIYFDCVGPFPLFEWAAPPAFCNLHTGLTASFPNAGLA